MSGWADFKRCPPEPDSLHEIYFEYDDENEYIARAHDNDREINRWAGTAEIGFPIIASALFDDAGILAGIRLVTDPRPDHRNDITEADRRKREDAYLFGGIMAARFMIEPKRDCVALPPAEGEGAVGSLFIKQSCELRDPVAARRIIVRASLYRKPGQSGFNPQMPTQLLKASSKVRLASRYLHCTNKYVRDRSAALTPIAKPRNRGTRCWFAALGRRHRLMQGDRIEMKKYLIATAILAVASTPTRPLVRPHLGQRLRPAPLARVRFLIG